jgi:hypothetical protein
MSRYLFTVLLSAWMAGACEGTNPKFRAVADAAAAEGTPGTGGGAGMQSGTGGAAGADAADVGGTASGGTGAGGAGAGGAGGAGAGGAGATVDLRSGLVGHWRLDEGIGSVQVADASNNGNVGMVVDTEVSTAWVPGKVNGAFRMDDTVPTSGVLVPRTEAIDSIRQLTAAAFVRRHQITAHKHHTVISRHHGDRSREIFNLTFNAGVLAVYLYAPQEEPAVGLQSITPTPIDEWIHVAVTYDGSTVLLYQDAQVVGTLAYGKVFPTSVTDLMLGNNINLGGATQPMVGVLDEVVLYRRALAAPEIAALAAGQTP